MASALSFELCADSNRIFKVRALVLDHKGLPTGRVVSPTATIATTLMAGVCPVHRTGRVQSVPKLLQASSRRRATVTSPSSTANNNNSNSSNINSNNNSNNNNAVSTSSSTHRGSVSASSSGAGPGAEGSSSAGTTALDGSDASNCGEDQPVSQGQETIYEWFLCRPGQRQGQLVQGDGGRLFLALPGDPVVFVFERRAVLPVGVNNNGRASRSGSLSGVPKNDAAYAWDGGRHNSYNNSYTAPRANTLVLVEIQYYFQMETGTVRAWFVFLVKLRVCFFSIIHVITIFITINIVAFCMTGLFLLPSLCC
jgi:hypothetical protein